ncbi:hypothetical protein FHS61_002580 [Altererythrobacter atlanticus]|uniref:Uncharacterized protein n=1 Tax=Croceibacterium atlanticum TaxID=1267766 RepID=A0A0F7KRP6_9SPHN|nr:hypothetical protein WYH_00840 [Croceibacterium atlanticum]MBB5733545.1 hypothetical protein [Croceibacterium atlanticum]
MLAIAISLLFGLAAVAAITVTWRSVVQGVAGARAILVELNEMQECEQAAMQCTRPASFIRPARPGSQNRKLSPILHAAA